MTMTIHAESVGGTPAARMIHEESQQLFIGHYVIDNQGRFESLALQRCLHASPPSPPSKSKNFVYLYDMENMFYEVNVHSLEFKKLFHDPIPGYHGKGGFTSQGKVVVSNNGETSFGHLDKPDLWGSQRIHK